MNTLVRYRPTGVSLFDDLDRVFGNVFNEDYSLSRTYPRVDIREDDGNYVLEAELPGLTEKDIEVKVEDNLLQISSGDSDKSDKSEKKEGNGYLVRERRSASFHRSFVLPREADREKIEAGFKNGLLTLTIPKTESAKPKQIEVKKA